MAVRINTSKLKAPERATTLEEAIRLLLNVMAANRPVWDNESLLLAAVWRRLAQLRQKLPEQKRPTLNDVAAILGSLKKEGIFEDVTRESVAVTADNDLLPAQRTPQQGHRVRA